MNITKYYELDMKLFAYVNVSHSLYVAESAYVLDTQLPYVRAEKNVQIAWKRNTAPKDHTAKMIQNAFIGQITPKSTPNTAPLAINIPTFLKQQELTALKFTQKANHKTALGMYFERYGYLTRTTYARITTSTTQDRKTPNLQTSPHQQK